MFSSTKTPDTRLYSVTLATLLARFALPRARGDRSVSLFPPPPLSLSLSLLPFNWKKFYQSSPSERSGEGTRIINCPSIRRYKNEQHPTLPILPPPLSLSFSLSLSRGETALPAVSKYALARYRINFANGSPRTHRDAMHGHTHVARSARRLIYASRRMLRLRRYGRTLIYRSERFQGVAHQVGLCDREP